MQWRYQCFDSNIHTPVYKYLCTNTNNYKSSQIKYTYTQNIYIYKYIHLQNTFCISQQSPTQYHMQTLQYCNNIRIKIDNLKSKKLPTKTKIMLIECLRIQLRNFYQFQNTSNLEGVKLDLSTTTFITQTKSIINKQDKQEQQTLIEQILKKQKLKIEIDQQIQTSQDDLNQIAKIVQTKHIYNEQLDQRIAQASRQIEKEKVRQYKQTKQDKDNKDKEKQKEKEKQKQKEKEKDNKEKNGKQNNAKDVRQQKQQKLSILQKVKSTPSLFKKIFS